MDGPSYLHRVVDSLLDELFAGLPAILLVGPRATGKTTSALRHARTVIRLDRPGEAAVMSADPDATLAASEEPILIDEWQMVPSVLGAIKRAVDSHPHPGRFLLTGSATSDLTAEGWPATGRVVRIPFWGLSMREILGNTKAAPLLQLLLDGEAAKLSFRREDRDLRGYIEAALTGGYPEVALQSSDRLRHAWLNSYVDQVVARDVNFLGEPRDPVRLRRYLHAIATNTACVVEHKKLYDAAGVNRLTARTYDTLFETLCITEQVPAWANNRIARLVNASKRYLVDSSLTGPLLGANERGVMRDGDQLGRLIDTFVTAQLRSELAVCEASPRLFHLRQSHGQHELDLVVEAADGRVLGIEIKATAAPNREMARHLCWMRDLLGDKFVCGIVFHTGPRAFRLDERVHAFPISALWTLET